MHLPKVGCDVGYYIAIIIMSIISEVAYSQIVPSNNFNYNQPCIHASQCNNNAGLYCSGLRCACPTNGTIFDEYQGRCVGRVGHPCVYQANQSFCIDKAKCAHSDPHHPDLYYYEARCFCENEYFSDKNGRCILAAKYGEPCSNSNKKCDELAGLICDISNLKCACKFGSDQFYDSKKDKCYSFIGKNCSGFNSCVENGRCDGISVSRAIGARAIGGNQGRGAGGPFPKDFTGRNVNGNKNVNDIGNNKETSSGGENVGKCICEFGFTPTKDGKCLAAYRQSCSETQICNPEDNLECLDGSCNCQSPLHQIYDHTVRRCVNLIGAKCDPRKDKDFVANSQCINGILRCNETYSQTPHRRCLLDYQNPCENGQCNMYNGLTCKSEVRQGQRSVRSLANKKCQCIDDSLLYNEKAKACVSQVSSPCGKFAQAGEYGKESFYIQCEPLAICKEEPGGDSNTKFCRLQSKDLKDYLS